MPGPIPIPADDDEAVREAEEAYRREMDLRNMVDFDDLVILTADLLESVPAVRAECRKRHPFVSIDEYQDVDAQQARLVKHLAPPNGNVCAIGDPDQAIYRFRGADARFFSAFGADHPGASMVRLTRNYRSDRNIVSLSSQVIAKSGSRHRAVPVIAEAPDLVTKHPPRTRRRSSSSSPWSRRSADTASFPSTAVERRRRRGATSRSPTSPCSTAPRHRPPPS